MTVRLDPLDTLHVTGRLSRELSERDVNAARRASPQRFARVRAACVGGPRVDLDAHAARIVLTLNRLEAHR